MYINQNKALLKVTLTIQVITGGQYDVDVKVEGPNKQIIYQQQKMQYDSHQFTAQYTGIFFVYKPLYNIRLVFLNIY